MDDYEKYEADCKKIRKANEGLLVEFETWLKSSSLSEKTIRTHLSNIDFYINEYLLYEDATEAKDGVHSVSMFLGYWFIKKAMWASQASIKSNAASLKKFYTFLLGKGFIDKEDLNGLNELKETIKEEMPEWLATLKRYDDPSIEEMEDVWGFR
jgi:site-specific recombinase XerD